MDLSSLHVYESLGVGKGVRQLDILKDVSMAVDGGVAGGNYRSIGVEGINRGRQSRQSDYYERSQ